MEKKTSQKQTEKIRRISEDLLNMNNGSSKKRKLVVQGGKQIEKKIRLKPDPTQLFSRFKPKEIQFDETPNVRNCENKNTSAVTLSIADPSKMAVGKVWTPPLKNLLPRTNIINNNDDKIMANQNQPFINSDLQQSSKRLENFSNQFIETNTTKNIDCTTEAQADRDDVKLECNMKYIGSNINSTQKIAIENPPRSPNIIPQNAAQKILNTTNSCPQSYSKVNESQSQGNSNRKQSQLHDSVNDESVLNFEQSQNQFKQYGYGGEKCVPDSMKESTAIEKSQTIFIDEIETNDEPVSPNHSNGKGFRNEIVPREVTDKKEYFKTREDEQVFKIPDTSYETYCLEKSSLKDDRSISSFPIQSEQKSNNSMEPITIHDVDSMKETCRKIGEESKFERKIKKCHKKENCEYKYSNSLRELDRYSQESNKKSLPTFIDLTNESEELVSEAFEPTVASSKKIECENDNIIIKKELDDTNDYHHCSSGKVRRTETVIENLKSPVVCKIFDEASNDTDVITFIGNESSKVKNYSTNAAHTKINSSDIAREVPEEGASTLSESSQYIKQENRNSKLGTNHDYNNEVNNEEDEKVMKEIRIYVYDSLNLSERQGPKDADKNEDLNDMSVKEPTGQLTDSQRTENDLVIDDYEVQNESISCLKQEVNNENFDIFDNSKAFSTGENFEKCQVEENYESNAPEDNHQQNEDKECFGQDGNEGNYEDDRNEESDPLVSNDGCEEEKVNSGNDTIVQLNSDDDAFDEDIEMTCTQLIHIENEYSNKTRDSKNVINNGPALQQRNNSLLMNRGVVQIPWVSNESKKNEGGGTISHPPIPWVKRLSEEKQKLRAVLQELVKLNGIIQQARQEIWPKMIKKDEK